MVKNHQMPATIRVDVALKTENIIDRFTFGFALLLLLVEVALNVYLGAKSQPCCISEPMVNHILFRKLKSFSSSSGFGSHGWGFTHSYGVILIIEINDNQN